MARTPDLAARLELLDRVIEYLALHGLGEATLRPMAAALGTTPNRLMHHFGTKEAMFAAALERTVERHREIEHRWLVREPALTQSHILRKWWRWMLASRANLHEVRLGLEAVTLDATVTGLVGSVRAEQIGGWRVNIERRLLADGVPAADAAIEATRVKAAFTGLTLDLLATGERARLTEALEQVLDDFDERVGRHLSRPSQRPVAATRGLQRIPDTIVPG